MAPGFREAGEQGEEEVPIWHLHGRKRGPSPPQEGARLLGWCRLACSDVQGLDVACFLICFQLPCRDCYFTFSPICSKIFFYLRGLTGPVL